MRTAPKDIDIIIGRNVRAARHMRGLSQSDLAEALEVAVQQVQKYEYARNRISASRLVDIARVLDVSITQLLPGDAKCAPGKPFSTPQTRQLLQYFEAISDTQLRRTILSLVEHFAKQHARTPAE